MPAIRDCEQRSFREKSIGIWVDAPELPREETREIFAQISPTFPVKVELDNLKSLTLGPRLIMAGSKAIGTCDGLTLSIAEASDEEIKELEKAPVISLARIAKG